ncbi:hypothetical protein Cni_G10205 [Canna indica]|uniref:Uncharacterized protein n=1 Tax=Canna indica TaxID=4628 RepID=A0AAQ3K5D8_9LILI|nr:hypothetical protein Cni_G10205 [Canna indica]
MQYQIGKVEQKVEEGSNNGEMNVIQEGNYVLQSGAAWAQNLKAGFGFVIKKQDENKLAGFNYGKAQNPLHAKAQAIWFGLDNCRKKKALAIWLSNLTVKGL